VSRPRRPQAQRLSQALDQALRRMGYGRRASALWAMAKWDQAVGPAVARHARPERAEGDVLFVVVDSAAWAHELRWMQEGLLQRLCEACGRRAVSRLVLRVGTLPSLPPAPTQKAPPLPPAPEAGKALVEAAARASGDPELWRAWQALVAQGLGRWKARAGGGGRPRGEAGT
jgi:hypothetical protein